jgi:flagellar motility protein MotE (MotC chaperone)
MSRARFLPVVMVVAGGALALRAVAGVADLPQMFDGAKAFAEQIAPKKADPKAAKDKAAVNALLAKAPPVSPGAALNPPAAPSPQACAPTPAELAKQAGMSPSELQVLQSLGARRTQLDAREQNFDTQLQLLAAAEAKVDTKLKQLASLKGDIQGLLGQADAKKDAELQRLVTIYEQMPPAAAAARMILLDDAVRLPLAAKMKPRKLSAILAQMPAADAKSVTEKLADRLGAADAARQALASNAPTPAAPAPAAATPVWALRTRANAAGSNTLWLNRARASNTSSGPRMLPRGSMPGIGSSIGKAAALLRVERRSVASPLTFGSRSARVCVTRACAAATR